MPAPLALGSPLWLRFFSAEAYNYVPKYVGVIQRIDGHRYFAGGKWHDVPNPEHAWTSEADALEYLAWHPFMAPTIK